MGVLKWNVFVAKNVCYLKKKIGQSEPQEQRRLTQENPKENKFNPKKKIPIIKDTYILYKND